MSVIDLFKNCDENKQFSAGSVIFEEDAETDALYVILSGDVEFTIRGETIGTESAGAGGMAGVAGLLLYWRDSGGLTSAWMQSSVGIGFGIGAVLGIIAFIFGVLTDRKLKAMMQLREQIQDIPSDEQRSQLQMLGKQQSTYLYICAATLSFALWIMASARYFVF